MPTTIETIHPITKRKKKENLEPGKWQQITYPRGNNLLVTCSPCDERTLLREIEPEVVIDRRFQQNGKELPLINAKDILYTEVLRHGEDIVLPFGSARTTITHDQKNGPDSFDFILKPNQN